MHWPKRMHVSSRILQPRGGEGGSLALMGLQAYQAVMCMMGGGGGVSGHTAREKRITELEEMCTHTAQCFSSDFSFNL
jgi:hypothetical protein